MKADSVAAMDWDTPIGGVEGAKFAKASSTVMSSK
jgi:hypothetical protein